MARHTNPREMSDDAVRELLRHEMCPQCLGELDTGYECNECGYDAMLLVKRFLP